MSLVDSLRQSLAISERICSVMKHSYTNNLLIKFKYSRISTGHFRIFSFNPQISSPLSQTLTHISSRLDSFNHFDKNGAEKLEVSLRENCGNILGPEISTVLAFRNGHTLTINRECYKIIENLPEISTFSLPTSLFVDFSIYPLIELMNCSQYSINWFVSRLPRKEAQPAALSTTNITDKAYKMVGNGNKSLILGKEFIGHELRVVVFPHNDNIRGFELIACGILEKSPEFPLRKLEICNENGSPKFSKMTRTFRLVSYNVLAASCTVDSYAKNELYNYCKPEALDPKYRKVLLNQEIIGLNADIICLQEDDMDIGLGSLESAYPTRNYRRTWQNNLTTIFRQDKFHLITEFCIELSEVSHYGYQYDQIRRMLESSSPEICKLFFTRKNIMQCTILGFNDALPGSQPLALCIGNTHLYSHPFADGIRLLQTTICINELTSVLNELGSRGYDSMPILCGDFNSLPTSGAYRFATGDMIRYNDTTWESSGAGGHKNSHIDRMAGMDLSHYLSLGSAVGTPDYTHCVSKFSGCIDYVFYDKNKLNVVSYLSFPDDGCVKENVALPSPSFPSDHMSLVVDLSTK